MDHLHIFLDDFQIVYSSKNVLQEHTKFINQFFFLKYSNPTLVFKQNLKSESAPFPIKIARCTLGSTPCPALLSGRAWQGVDSANSLLI